MKSGPLDITNLPHNDGYAQQEDEEAKNGDYSDSEDDQNRALEEELASVRCKRA